MTIFTPAIPLVAGAGYRPFLDPLNLHAAWYLLLIPLALGIAIAYKAVRLESLKDYWRQVLVMTVQIVLGMIALGLASFLLVEYVFPLIVPK